MARAKKAIIIPMRSVQDQILTVNKSVLNIYAEPYDSELGDGLAGINGGTIHDRRKDKEKQLVFISAAFNPLTAQQLLDVAASMMHLARKKKARAARA
jgi:hypothetical protein